MQTEKRCKLRGDHIGRYTPSAVICLCIVLAAFGVSQLVEEGPNANVEDRARSSATGLPGSINNPDGWINSLLQLEGQVDAYPSNVPSIPGWDGIRVHSGNDVPSMVEPTPAPTEETVDVVPAGSDTSTSVPGIAPPPDVAEIACAYDWDCGTAVRIINCETGGTFDPYATGYEDERGWFQIRFNHWDKPQCNPNHLFDPAYNTACAYSIWAIQGWTPWSCY